LPLKRLTVGSLAAIMPVRGPDALIAAPRRTVRRFRPIGRYGLSGLWFCEGMVTPGLGLLTDIAPVLTFSRMGVAYPRFASNLSTWCSRAGWLARFESPGAPPRPA